MYNSNVGSNLIVGNMSFKNNSGFDLNNYIQWNY